jgi:hypothetical protein
MLACAPNTLFEDKLVKKDVVAGDSASPSFVLLGQAKIAVPNSCIKRGISIKIMFAKWVNNAHTASDFTPDLIAEQYIYSTVIPYIFANSYSPNMIAFYGIIECNNFNVNAAGYLPWEKFETKHDKESYDLSRFKGIITEKAVGGKPVKLGNWIRARENLEEFDTIVVQIIYTCTMMDQIGLLHNDLHEGNLFIDDLGSGNRVAMKFCIGSVAVVEISTRYVVKIYDWDRSVKVSTKYSPLSVVKPIGNTEYARDVPDPLEYGGVHVAVLNHLVPGGNISRIAHDCAAAVSTSQLAHIYMGNDVFKRYFLYLYSMFGKNYYLDDRMQYGLWIPKGEKSYFRGEMIDYLRGLTKVAEPGGHVALYDDPNATKGLGDCTQSIYALPSAQWNKGITPIKAIVPAPLKFNVKEAPVANPFMPKSTEKKTAYKYQAKKTMSKKRTPMAVEPKGWLETVFGIPPLKTPVKKSTGYKGWDYPWSGIIAAHDPLATVSAAKTKRKIKRSSVAKPVPMVVEPPVASKKKMAAGQLGGVYKPIPVRATGMANQPGLFQMAKKQKKY